MNQDQAGPNSITPWDGETDGEATHAAPPDPLPQGDSEEEGQEAKPQPAEPPARALTMGKAAESAGKARAPARSSIHPPSGSKPRKRGRRKPELQDVLTQAGLREDVKRLRAIIAKGSHKEALEAFRLLYGSAGDPRRGPVKPGPGGKRAPGISLPDA